MANLFTVIKIGSLKNLKDIESRLNELGFNTHFLNNYNNMWTKNSTIINCVYLYLDDSGLLHLSFIAPKFNRICSWDCKDNIEAFLSFAALKGKTDFGKLFSYPITKIKKLPGYFPQTVGMDGTQVIKVGEKIFKYDKKDSELTRKIEFELSCEGTNKDLVPHILEEQEIWDYYKLG